MTTGRVRILHVLADLFSKGGTPRKLLSLVQFSDKKRFQHIFLVFANHPDNLNEAMREAGAVVEEIFRPRNWDLRIIADIKKTVLTYDVDIINTHFARADVYGALAGKLVGKPVIQNVHGILWNSSWLLRSIDRWLSPLRAEIICNSRASLKEVRRRQRTSKGKVIYNGVPDRALVLNDAARLSLRQTFNIPNGSFVVGHVGGLIPIRDQHVIIDALKQLVQQGRDISLIFVGDGPLREGLEDRAAARGLSGNVRFLGYRDDVPALLNIFDVYVNVARAEGFGIAVVEAMQAGVPVVVANAGSLPELIEDHVSGMLVPPGDSFALATAIQHFADHPEEALRLGEGARLRAAREFSMTRYVREIEKIYLELRERHT